MADYTMGTFQLCVNDRRRCAETEEEETGWIGLDAWIIQRVALLKARHPHQTISSLPLFCLFEDTDE